MTSKETPLDESLSFEEALCELESIAQQLEDGQLSLADALAIYEQGVKRLQQCHTMLKQAESRIELLSGFDAQGNAVTESFAEPDRSLEEKAAARSRRRSHRDDADPSNEPGEGGVLF